ncbi:hypothetical protein [Paenibacillus glacialis]|uniref:Uncharacterized protein n=1 Tax=Paenibacillus glacialis TaxID=494026 RepID=A0A168KDE6_9BACL|nr:hypothetical protein [Paenibacillus glacialis]OAB41865.1 hypothetical protein PGLA_14815 [Paenibacillus glacialis]
MSHLVWELATYHFDNWLKTADVYAEKKIRPKPNFDYDYNSIVFFPRRRNRPEKHTFKIINWRELKCPYVL